MGKEKNKPHLPDPKNRFETSLFFEVRERQFRQLSLRIKDLKAIALSPEYSSSEKRKAIREADKLLKRKPGYPKRMDNETLQLLTEQFSEWKEALTTIQKLYRGFLKQGMSKSEALDTLTEIPRLSFFSKGELKHIVNTNVRPYILSVLSRASGFKESTLGNRIRLTKLQ